MDRVYAKLLLFIHFFSCVCCLFVHDVIFDLEMEILHGESTSAQPQALTLPLPFSNITNYNGLMLCKADKAPPRRPLLTLFEHGYFTLFYKFCF